MPPEVFVLIAKYGYLAIFALVFSQEIGIPNPIPNELVLMFSGYLSFKQILSLPLLILTAVIADVIGTSLLYFTFYLFGKYILNNKPKWLPISQKKIDKLSTRVQNGGLWTIYLGRITPFIRGYTSVITGLLQIKPRIFLPIAVISALTWSSVCVTTGRLLGPYWSDVGNKVVNIKVFLITCAAIILLVFYLSYLKKRIFKKQPEDNRDL